MRGAPAALLGTVMWLCAAAPAHAAPTWLAPVEVSIAAPFTSAPQIGGDGAGDAFAVWLQPSGSEDQVVEAAERPAGGTWQRLGELSSAQGFAQSVHLAVDAQGDAIVAWQETEASQSKILAAFHAAGAAGFQPAVTVSPGTEASGPYVAIAPHGEAMAVWNKYVESDLVVEAAERSAATGAWQTPVQVSKGESHYAAGPSLKLDAQGDAMAIWTRFEVESLKPTEEVVQTAWRPASTGVWQKPEDRTEKGGFSNSGAIGLDAQGDAVALWLYREGVVEVARASVRPASTGSWTLPQTISTGTQNPTAPLLAVDPQGDAFAIWHQVNAVQVTVRPASSGAWQPPQELAQFASQPSIALDQRGDAIAAWQEFSGSFEIQARTRSAATGVWEAPLTVAPPIYQTGTQQPQVALDDQGNAVAGWLREEIEGPGVIEAAGYDAAGPQLKSLSIPAGGVAGQALGFSVSPLDVWSPIASTIWSFGDGSAALGTSVTHTYSAPGTYQVSVTGIDGVANSSVASGTIAIAPALKINHGKATAPSAPAISSVSQSHARWREGRMLPTLARKRKARTPTGTVFSFTLDQPARVQLLFTQRLRGRKVKGKCVPASRRNRRAPGCRRTVKAGLLTLSGHAGVDRISFQGRISPTSKLRPGSFAVQITATGATGLRSRPATLRFTVVR